LVGRASNSIALAILNVISLNAVETFMIDSIEVEALCRDNDASKVDLILSSRADHHNGDTTAVYQLESRVSTG
jgi:hypothetical protein